jgi:methionine-S-sulfoxide reductase
MEPPFQGLKGVLKNTVGYTGGSKENPTYEEVCSGKTGHAEGIQVLFDPRQISYQELLEIFWRNIDPTTKDAQFADRGTQYRTAIFYHNDEQQKLAEESRRQLENTGRFKGPIVTEIAPASKFYPAEEYHQQYSKKNPVHYKLYRLGSGRETFLKESWEKKERR